MKSQVFKCEQFEVKQDKSAMKVGTDSLVLGAWADVSGVESALDIGTGTGILALMIAQRSDAHTIDAVEIEENAFEEAVTNFENSPWGDRLFCYHSSLQEFMLEIEDSYDLIICNPPYFKTQNITEATPREIARHTHLLNHITLLKAIKKLLSKDGKASVSLPFAAEGFFLKLAESYGFKVQKIMRMKNSKENLFTRSFVQIGWEEMTLHETELIVRTQPNVYSEAYKKLTSDFYTIF